MYTSSKKVLEERVKRNLLMNAIVNINEIKDKDNYYSFYSAILDKNVYLPKEYLYTLGNSLFLKVKKFLPKENGKYNFFIAGGAVLDSILYGNVDLINDIDLFFKSEEDFKTFKISLENENKSMTTIRFFETPNAIKYKIEINHTTKVENLQIDLIKKSFQSLSSLLFNFDLDPCRVGFECKYEILNGFEKVNVVFGGSKRLQDIFNFEKLSFEEYEMSVWDEKKLQGYLRRLYKYAQKGYSASHKTYQKFLSNLYDKLLYSLIVEFHDPGEAFSSEAIELKIKSKIGSVKKMFTENEENKMDEDDVEEYDYFEILSSPVIEQNQNTL